MKAKPFALLATLFAGVLVTIQPASALIQSQTWLGWFTGEYFTVHCQTRNTQTTDYLHWGFYRIDTCNIEATWGTPGSPTHYYDHADDHGPTTTVPNNGTSLSNVVVTIPYACPAALFGSNHTEAYNVNNQEFYPNYAYDTEGMNCGDPW